MVGKLKKLAMGLVTTAPMWIIFSVIIYLIATNFALVALDASCPQARSCIGSEIMNIYNFNTILILLVVQLVFPATYLWNLMLVKLSILD